MADELELIEDLIQKVDKLTEKHTKDYEKVLKEAKDLTTKEVQQAKEEADKDMKEQKETTALINKELAEKGATLKQIQEELLELKAKKGRIFSGEGEEVASTVKLLKEGFAKNFDKIKEQANEPSAAYKFKLEQVGDMLIKSPGTMTASSNLTGNVVATYSLTPAVRARQKLHIRDLLNVIPSATGLWKFYRQNKPVGEGSFDTQSTHGNAKAQVDYDTTEVTITVDYLAGFARIAKQMLQDLPFMQTFVSNELVEDYLRAEDSKFFQALSGAATGNVTGLLGTDKTVEKIIKVIGNLGEDDYDCSGILVTNADWAKILLTKPNDYSIPGGVTISANGDVMICGIPLFRTKAQYLGTGQILMGDWSKAAIIQTEGLNVNMYEQDSDNVQRNLITVKAEARVALATLRTDAFAYFGSGTT